MEIKEMLQAIRYYFREHDKEGQLEFYAENLATKRHDVFIGKYVINKDLTLEDYLKTLTQVYPIEKIDIILIDIHYNSYMVWVKRVRNI